MNSITNSEDAVANKVIYHDVCWVKAKQEVQPKPIKVGKFVQTLSVIKLVDNLELKFLSQKDWLWKFMRKWCQRKSVRMLQKTSKEVAAKKSAKFGTKF